MRQTGSEGLFIAVVGASGAGKDTVLEGAKATLQNDAHFHFPKRYITRSPGAGGEPYIAVNDHEFDTLSRRNQLCLRWDAHGLSYGLPIDIEQNIRAGHSVVVNVSRRAIADALRRFPFVRIIEIYARPEVVAQRLVDRGRETIAEIEMRKRRSICQDWAQGRPVVQVDNSTLPCQAIERFTAVLRNLTAKSSEPSNLDA